MRHDVRRADRAQPAPAARGRPARGARSAEVELPRDDVARAAHAADQRDRLRRDDGRGPRRSDHARAEGLPDDDPRQGRSAARA